MKDLIEFISIWNRFFTIFTSVEEAVMSARSQLAKRSKSTGTKMFFAGVQMNCTVDKKRGIKKKFFVEKSGF